MPDLRWAVRQAWVQQLQRALAAGTAGMAAALSQQHLSQPCRSRHGLSQQPCRRQAQQTWQQHQPVQRPVVPITGCCGRLPKGPCAAVLPIHSMPLPPALPAAVRWCSSPRFRHTCRAARCGLDCQRHVLECVCLLHVLGGGVHAPLRCGVGACALGMQSHTCANSCWLPRAAPFHRSGSRRRRSRTCGGWQTRQGGEQLRTDGPQPFGLWASSPAKCR